MKTLPNLKLSSNGNLARAESMFPNAGVWELPMASHYGASVDGGFCPYLDQCVLLYLSEDGVVNWLKADFHRHYDTNR